MKTPPGFMFNSAVWAQGKTLSCGLLLIEIIEIFLSKKKKRIQIGGKKQRNVQFISQRINRMGLV